VRVSTRNGQSPENEIQALCGVASEFDRLLKDAARCKFEVLMAWSVDRLGRSLQDLVSFLGEIHANGIDLYLHVQGVDTTTPAGRALF
jgi:DNA invertase Pin-like site-specific DNA recombinase